MAGLTIATKATEFPISLAQAKSQCRVDITDDDIYILGLVEGATELVQTITRRALITQTWDWVFDAFPSSRELIVPLPPLQSVTSVKYYDEDDTEATMSSDDYIVDTDTEPGRIVLRNDASWPSTTLRAARGVIMRFVAGYGDDEEDVPMPIRNAIKLIVGHYYENREATAGVGNMQIIPMGVDLLLWNYKALRF